MNALSQLGVTPFNGYGDMSGQKQPKKPQNGIMNVLSKVFEYGAPEAFEQGRQKKHQNALSSALQSRDFGGAADAAFASGNINGGLDLLDYNRSAQSAQSEAGQAEKVKKLQGMAAFAQNMRQIPEAERGRWAMDNWQMLEPIVGKDFMTYWQESGGDVSDASLDEDLLAIQTALGQGPAAPVEGKVVNNRLVDPTTGDVIGDFSDPKQVAFKTIELADGIYQYDPANPTGTMQKMGVAPAKKPLVNVNTGDVTAGQRPIVAKPEQGFQRVWDGEANTYRDAPIPGGTQEREVIQANNEAQINLQKLEEDAQFTLDTIDDLLNDEGFDLRYGLSSVGGVMPSLPGGGGARVQSRIDQIGGQAFLQAYEKLKGGGVITDFEGKKATDALARALDQNLSGPDARAAFEEFKGYIKMGIERERRKINASFKNEGPVPIEDLIAKYGD